uniref:Uncharacterized protein n=1 Tax=Kalanchoe fedtschenkoi TaxID=63787 RepID=A0A7N0TDE6_KALFE
MREIARQDWERTSANGTSEFASVLEIFEVAPALFMVDVRKAAGDTLEYHKMSELLKLMGNKVLMALIPKAPS